MNLYLNPKWQRIGISLSGGADSALLAYLICSKTKADIHFTTQIRMWRTRPWAEYVAGQVVSWFETMFDNKFYHHTNLVPPEMEEPGTTLIRDEYGMLKPGNRIILRSFNEYIGNKHKLEALYAGLNKNPDVDLKNALKERDSGEQVQPHFMHDGIHIVHPFINTSKDWIIQQYYKKEITDLLNITRSCEGEFKDITYKTYSPGQYVPTCGDCFWCREREWALSTINEQS